MIAATRPAIDLVVGARPNFMKAAPLIDVLRAVHPDWKVQIVHTGQHYDERMSDLFFRQLAMPSPAVNLGVGSGTQAQQLAKLLLALEEQFLSDKPDLVIVFGDVNSTLATALIASRLLIPLAHVEAGLRSFDRTMPEEINRTLTDSLSALLFTTERSANENLRREGVPSERIHFVGNLMIDTLLKHLAQAETLQMTRTFGLEPKRYGVLTLHRPSNVDDEQALGRILTAIRQIAAEFPIVFPVHPRAQSRIHSMVSRSDSNLRMVAPLGYLEFLGLMRDAAVVLTDSGGIQEEAFILRVPCVTLRENTERPVTLTGGANVLVGADSRRIVAEALAAFRGKRVLPASAPENWDGKAAHRIVSVLEGWFAAALDQDPEVRMQGQRT